MRMDDIRIIARERGIKSGNLKKGELIKKIQTEEGNTPCFGEDRCIPCGQGGCLWFTDCQPN